MIIGVALVRQGTMHWLLAPNRHHNVIRMMSIKMLRPAGCQQGFVDERGLFYTREKARIHAIQCGQVINTDHPRELFSEDLW
jgi:hypothetical protein